MNIEQRVEKFKKSVRDSQGANKERVNSLTPDERSKELIDEAQTYFWFMDKAGYTKLDIEYSLLMQIDREIIEKYLERIQ